MIKAVKPRRGRPRRDPREKLQKVRYFRVRPSLDRMLEAAAKESGRSVSEEIERHLDRAFDSAALLDMLLGKKSAMAVRLFGLLTRAMTMHPFVNWASDEQQRAALKVAAGLLIDAIARDELTIEHVNTALRALPPELTDEARDNLRDGALRAFTLFNPREDWIRPAPPHVQLVQPD